MASNQENYRSYSKLTQICNCFQKDYSIPYLARRVLQKEGDINYRIPPDSRVLSSTLIGGTVLHIAVIQNDVQVFDMLLDNDADITIQNQQGRTALHLIADQAEAKKEFLELVFSTHLSLGDPTNPSDRDGISHLHIACMSNHVGAVEFFLDNGVPVDAAVAVDSKKYAGYTPLHFAAARGALTVCKVLLKHNASSSARDARGLTPLHLLLGVKIKLMDSISTKLEKQAAGQLNADMDEVVNLLLDDNDVDHLGLTHFHIACTSQDSSVAEYFLEQNVDVYQQVNKDSPFCPGYTALHFAAHCNPNIARMLLRKSATFEVRDANGLTPMDLFWRKRNPADIQAIFAQNWGYIMFSDMQTRLADCVNCFWDENAMRQFLQKVEDLSMTIYQGPGFWIGRTLLHFAVLMCKSVDVVKPFLTHGLTVEHVNTRDASDSTPIHLAFRANKLEFVEIMMQHCQDCKNLLDADGLSYLHIACALKDPDLVDQFCQDSWNADAHCRVEYAPLIKPGSTALHVAVASGNEAIVKKLLQLGMNPVAEDAKGETPIHRFLHLTRKVEAVGQVLLMSAAVSDDAIKKIGLTRLHLALYSKALNMYQYIKLDSIGAALCCVDPTSPLHKYDGCTPLHMAVKMRSNLNIVQELLKRDEDLLSLNHRGDCPLYEVLQRRSDWVLLHWIVSKFQHNAALRKQLEDMSGITMLHLVCHVVNMEAVNWLLIGDVDVNARVKSDCPIWAGCTPIHVLLKEIELKKNGVNVCSTLKIILEKDVDVSIANDDGETPIHLALQNFGCMFAASALLIENLKDFSVNPVDRNGMSHFHAACLVNNTAAVKLFIQNCAVDVDRPIDFFAPHFPGETALHLALEYKTEAIFSFESKQATVELLLAYGADVKAEDSRGHSPLHKAAKLKNHLDFMRMLVSHGALVTCRNIFLQTPLELLLKSEHVSAKGIQFFASIGCCLNFSNSLTEEGSISMLISRHYHMIYRRQAMNAIAEVTLHKLETSSVMIGAIDACLSDDAGRSPIHNIVTTNDPCVEISSHNLLIKQFQWAGVDIDLQDKTGKTALHLAAQFGNGVAVESLLNAGVDVNIVDAKNLLALEYAVEYYYNEKYCPEKKCHLSVILHLVSHVRKLQLLNLEVSDGNVQEKANILQTIVPLVFYEDRVEARLRKSLSQVKSVRDGDLCMADFLSETGRGLTSYPFVTDAKREEIDGFFAGEHPFGELKGVCMLQYRKAVKRVRLVKPAVNSVWALAKTNVPVVCVELIFQYLGNKDLENFIEATDAIEKVMIFE